MQGLGILRKGSVPVPLFCTLGAEAKPSVNNTPVAVDSLGHCCRGASAEALGFHYGRRKSAPRRAATSRCAVLRPSTCSMSTSDYAKFQKVAVAAAQAAGLLIGEAFNKDKSIEFKGKLDLVTATDKDCEVTIFKAIRDAFPDHKFIGEEGSAAQGFTNDLTDAPTW